MRITATIDQLHDSNVGIGKLLSHINDLARTISGGMRQIMGNAQGSSGRAPWHSPGPAPPISETPAAAGAARLARLGD